MNAADIHTNVVVIHYLENFSLFNFKNDSFLCN